MVELVESQFLENAYQIKDALANSMRQFLAPYESSVEAITVYTKAAKCATERWRILEICTPLLYHPVLFFVLVCRALYSIFIYIDIYRAVCDPL